MAPQSLVLVDGSSYLYRAFHALPALTNSHGEHTGAVHGVVAMLKKLMASYEPARVAVVFDAKGETFRNELYAEYKANRPPMPDELSVQVEPLFSLIRALGLPLIVEPGVEADDVIGTLAVAGADAGYDVVISSSDKDLAQLVSPRISLVNTMDDVTLDEAGVRKKFGVPPERIVDYLTLVGDKVDNIPGVDKVGPKTAVKLLETYGSLEGVIAHADEIGGRVGENLRAALDRLPLSKTLVTIRCDVALGEGLDDLVPAQPDLEALVAQYSALEFKNWLREILDDESAATAEAAEYECVTDAAGFARWLEELNSAGAFAFDTETTSLNYMEARVVGVSLAVAPGRACYVPFGHDYAGAPDQLSEDEVLGGLKPLLEDPALGKLGHNLKYDASVIANHGITLAGIRHDTMLESYVFNATASRHDLDTVALKYLGHNTIHFEDVAGKGANQLTFNEVPLDVATPYAAEDAEVVMRLHAELRPRIEDEGRLAQVLDEIEVPLVSVLSRIERNGVRVDTGLLAGFSTELAERIAELEGKAHEIAGEPFNLGSPKQLQTILYDKLGLPVRQKTPKGQPSTAEAVLAELAEEYELPSVLMEYRALTKLKSTYADALPKVVNPSTGRVHTSYHQAVAATGRLSSSDPNLQNIPIRTPLGRRIRQAFVAREGARLVAADYSQIELRIMAHLSGDAQLLSAFEAGEDVHRATAAEVFDVALAEVGDEQRRAAKAINFGLMYGMSAFGLGRQLGIERSAAQEYIDLYFERYPGVRAFMERIRTDARELGYVETVFGRRLYLPDITSRNNARRQYAERTAINAPMQGTAADIIKRAMIAVDAWIERDAPEVTMIMQVHDELVFEIPEHLVDAATGEITTLMATAAELSVPLKVDAGAGANWDEAH